MWLTGLRGLDWMPDIWQEFDRVQRDASRLFSGTGTNYYETFPAINLWMSEDNLVVSAEIPGIDPAEIDITVEGDALQLSGLRKVDDLGEGARYHRQERPRGGFKRKVRLPFPVESGRVEAQYEKGVLTVSLPRIEDDKPKKINIKSE